MWGEPRIWIQSLFLTALWAGVGGTQTVDSPATKPPTEAAKPDAPTADRPISPEEYALPGENPPRAFVPKTPLSVEERREIETIRLFTIARSQEYERRFRDAIATLEKALATEPESIAILRRLSRLTGALGQIDRSIEFSTRALALDPNDAETLIRLVEFYRGRRKDPGRAEKLLSDLLANPRLDPARAPAILARFELVKLLASSQRFREAAEALTKVVESLDEKAALELSPTDQRRILGLDEAGAYQDFGMIFLAGGKRDWAVRSFRRGLTYTPSHPQLTLLLGQTLLEDGKPGEALDLAESLLPQRPRAREPYDLLVRALSGLKRDAEVIPRLEAAAKADPKNVPLQYVLVDLYRSRGMTEQADALTNRLIDLQPDLQGYPGLFNALLEAEKSPEMLRLLEKVAGRIGRIEAVDPQLQSIIRKEGYADRLLDIGLGMLESEPAKLSEVGYRILRRLATLSGRNEKTVALLRWSLRKEPDPLAYRELAIVLAQSGKNGEGASLIQEMLEKYPNERNPQSLILLAQLHLRDGKEEPAIVVLRDALKIDPRDLQAARLLAISLNTSGKTDEAVALLRKALVDAPTDVELNATLGGVLATAGRDDESITFWRSLLERYPNNEELVRIARSSLSIVYSNQGDFAKAEAELEILLAKNPDEPGVNNDLGYLYADQGKNLEKAEAMIRKAVEEDPENSSYLDSLAWVLYKRGKKAEALPLLEKAVKNLTTDDATIHDHLGQVYFDLGEREKARASWREAERIAASAKPPDKRLEDIRKRLASLETLAPTSTGSTEKKP
ncbi:MAG: tetratricopeptide repeat protein [Isosphaeraceae bacterium]|nr:tetratricopeptide repeat protein [Isosphaeraceae bacterium]